MITLRLLGSVDLRGHEGELLEAPLAQPKRLALLAYLAAATPPGLHSRDSLLALLWPELNQAHARAALRQALYVLRQALGSDALLGCGNSVLGLNAKELWCDATAFDQAFDTGEHATAVELYRGELLAGFHLCGAREFEWWLDGARARLASRAEAAAWSLVDREQGNGSVARALHWARWLLNTHPDDERALQRVVALLWRLGDRAAALRVYRVFAERLAAEYAIAPAAETAALISAIRASERREMADARQLSLGLSGGGARPGMGSRA